MAQSQARLAQDFRCRLRRLSRGALRQERAATRHRAVGSVLHPTSGTFRITGHRALGADARCVAGEGTGVRRNGRARLGGTRKADTDHRVVGAARSRGRAGPVLRSRRRPAAGSGTGAFVIRAEPEDFGTEVDEELLRSESSAYCAL